MYSRVSHFQELQFFIRVEWVYITKVLLAKLEMLNKVLTCGNMKVPI